MINLKNAHSSAKNNSKDFLYRGITVTVRSFGRYNEITDYSPYAVLNKLHTKEVITKDQFNKYSNALTIANEMRLALYTAKDRQSDIVDNKHNVITHQSTFDDIVHKIGERSLVDFFSYFHDLQCLIRCKKLSANDKLNAHCLLYTSDAADE